VITKNTIIKYEKGKVYSLEDSLAVEKEVVLIINQKKEISFHTSPEDLKELIFGYMLTQGIVKSFKQVKDCCIFEVEGKVFVITEIEKRRAFHFKSLRNSVFFEDRRLSVTWLFEVKKLIESSLKNFEKTGCFHFAALGREDFGNKVLISEDIGRYNAIDKVVGKALFYDFPIRGSVLFVSGRIFELTVKKAINIGVKALVSRGAPTNEAVNFAKNNDLTLIGFFRNSRFNVYTFPERIKT